MQEIKLVPQIDDFKTMFGGASDLNISPVDVKVQHDIFVSYLYILFAVAGLISVALIYHWFRYGLSGFFATVVTVFYGLGTLVLFGYLLKVVGLQ